MELQPLLHDLHCALAAPTQAWSDADGQVRGHGVQGFWHGDVRVLSRAEVHVDGVEPETLRVDQAGADRTVAVALLRHADSAGADPTLRLVRTRTVRPGRIAEELRVESAAEAAVELEVVLTVGCDLAAMDVVKQGRAPGPIPGSVEGDALTWAGADTVARLAPGRASLDLGPDAGRAEAPVLRWQARVEPGSTWAVTWELEAEGRGAMLPAGAPPTWSAPTVRADDRRLPALVTQALGDLGALRMRADFAPGETFVAAGAPWFFTLFGRDSLWAARMLLPLGTELAAGTLRTLAARQGVRHDPVTAEQPGKILHEVRALPLDLGEGGKVLPPVYYGTVDATPLWVSVLHDAWRWGMPESEVAALVPAAERALTWVIEHGDADGDGFLEYLDRDGSGLANQGWKDSGDSVQWRDGRLADGPIALCEVQAYAYEAAYNGARLLAAFDRPADRWLEWADRLRTRFRERFWVSDERGAYPAIALDLDKRPVDSLTSNIGHLLGTGLLDADEEAAIAGRLAGDDMDSGYGLRTLSTTSGGYWPLRYHGGSVWTHDTAIAIRGLARSGHLRPAASLAEGLLKAAAGTGYRAAELHSGDPLGATPGPVPYPAACRPQAWAAASAIVLLEAAIGIEPDVPAGTLTVGASAGLLGALSVDGLKLGAHDLAIRVDAHGEVAEVVTGAPVEVRRSGRGSGV